LSAPSPARIGRVTPEQIPALIDQLASLLQDAVADGASLGFMAPLALEDARAYWLEVAAVASTGARLVLGAFDADELVGSVQLDLARMPNAQHRADVMKLMVLRRARRRGTARALMQAVEDAARDASRTLLVLDTWRGSVAEELYEGIGYRRVGIVPRYALSSDGILADTVFFHKELPAQA
jgi:GNAT superfamily N-acetyltransferase